MKKKIWMSLLVVFMLVAQFTPQLKADTYKPETEYIIENTGADVRDTRGYSAWWRSGIGKITVNGKVAFCIEPEMAVTTTDGYTEKV